jgi:phosphatidylglycerophosphatase A
MSSARHKPPALSVGGHQGPYATINFTAAGPAMPKPAEPTSVAPWRLGPAVWLASGFWIGFVPVAPGTFGALWGLPLAWSIAQAPALAVQGALVVLLCAVGVPLCTAAARRLGGAKDPQAIVWDEIASMPIVFFALPAERVSSPWILAAGFALHRLFDITKPPPARQLERLPAGLGVMADDWIAAAYAGLVLHLLVWSGLIP